MGTALTVLSLNTERTWRGGEGQTLALARGLLERGHRSLLVAQPASPLAERARAAGLPVFEEAMRSEVDLLAVRRLCRILRRERPDVVHMHTSHAHTLGALASLATGVGARVVSRRVDFSIHRHRVGLSGLKYRLLATRYIAISEAVRAALVRDGIPPAKISLVFSGVDPRRFLGGDAAAARRDLGVPEGAPLVGTLAHFGWHKSLETLVQASASIVAAVPEAWVALVGEGSLRPRIEEERSRSPVRGRILLPGFRSNVADFLAAFDVFVMPSVMEGLCTAILDAFAVHRPVVAARAGGIPELVEHEATGLLVEPRDPGALADAVVRVLGDPALARRLTDAAHARLLAQFTEDAMVEGTLAVYRELLGARAATAS